MEEDNVEDQYIKGLQDEVKLLEYELKLLKDKDTEEMENFSHFFKFFNDGVPINENIIAMKNLYQYTQKNLEDQIKVSRTRASRTHQPDTFSPAILRVCMPVAPSSRGEDRPMHVSRAQGVFLPG